jgi:aromatic ring-opening dioxygenase LigB subunit
MITFAAFTPHSPLLIPSIGKENTDKLALTRKAMLSLSEELYASRPDILLSISSHQSAHPDAFSLNLHESYSIQFHEFGDHAVRAKFFPDLELIAQIQNIAYEWQLPFTLDSDPLLDYGLGVPLTLLTTPHQPKLVPVSYANLSPKLHLQFGRALKDACVQNKKRVAIIASGDLSHALRSDSPAGFHPSGVLFDETIRQSIENMSISQLLSLDHEQIEHASESAYRSMLILFGMLERMQVRPEILSYENPFGVGELVAQFHFSVI